MDMRRWGKICSGRVEYDVRREKTYRIEVWSILVKEVRNYIILR